MLLLQYPAILSYTMDMIRRVDPDDSISGIGVTNWMWKRIPGECVKDLKSQFLTRRMTKDQISKQIDILDVAHYGHQPIKDAIRTINDVLNAGEAIDVICVLDNIPLAFPHFTIGTMADWLHSLIGDSAAQLRLKHMSWDQACRECERWQERIEREAMKTFGKPAGDDGTTDRVPTFHGHEWVRLATVEALDRETAAMGHCVGKGSYDSTVELPSLSGGIWSLRDAQGVSVLTAHVMPLFQMMSRRYTASGDLFMKPPKITGVGFQQVLGPRNVNPKPSEWRHAYHLFRWYKRKGMDAKTSFELLHHATDEDERLADMRDMEACGATVSYVGKSPEYRIA